MTESKSDSIDGSVNVNSVNDETRETNLPNLKSVNFGDFVSTYLFNGELGEDQLTVDSSVSVGVTSSSTANLKSVSTENLSFRVTLSCVRFSVGKSLQGVDQASQAQLVTRVVVVDGNTNGSSHAVLRYRGERLLQLKSMNCAAKLSIRFVC